MFVLFQRLWFDVKKLFVFFLWFPSYIKDYFLFRKQLVNSKDIFKIKVYPIMSDKFSESWEANWHYFHQDLLIAKKVLKKKPDKHVDIWSRIDWFVAHVASFRKIEVIDIRPNKNNIENIIFKQMDMMNLDNKYLNYCSSLSSLHAIEHFGLWRYWDPIDINWHKKAVDNFHKILKKWWTLYISVPIWPQRIEFNAHRVFSLKYLLELFKNFELIYFSYVDDKGDLHQDFRLDEEFIRNNCWCQYGCWIFEFMKI